LSKRSEEAISLPREAEKKGGTMNYRDFPILVIDDTIGQECGCGRAIEHIIASLEGMGFSVIVSACADDGIEVFDAHTEVSCVLVDWEIGADDKNHPPTSTDIVENVRSKNDEIPIFIMTESHKVQEIPLDVLRKVQGYVWKMEDTPHFIAGKVEMAAKKYVEGLMPPFFKELVKYTDEYKYAWHTPGHMGGLAFLKSPAGRVFYDFFGENVFRADLSVSVPELGSLMEHAGVNGEAERLAAKTFGADDTFFVTNGTSTANKMVMFGCVTPGDVVLVDRNCHKSLQHAITMTGAIPIYLTPSRNAYGIIGGIHESEFDAETIRRKVEASPLIKDKRAPIRQVTVTNSTYDGLTYNTVILKEKLKHVTENLHFDEAWYAYARFNPIYTGRYAMTDEHSPDHPAIFSTQSTHKLLAAFSQASMVHVKSGRRKIDHDRFNEAFMMHTSTSPQYGIIASLDVATKMMQGSMGRALVQDSIDEAVIFRKKMTKLGDEIKASESDEAKRWFFQTWQQEKITSDIPKAKGKSFEDVDTKILGSQAGCWTLNPGDAWHGFAGMEPNYMMLDPIKVTILTPGMHADATMGEWGIPAPMLSRFLMSRGIVVEKTGFFATLLLFSIGVTKGKSGSMLAELFDFKRLFDDDAVLADVYPDLVASNPMRYGAMRIKQLAAEMHGQLKSRDIANVTNEVFSILPDQVMTPLEAYSHLVRDNVEEVPMRETMGRIPAVMLVPYPPGIPIIMPGEKITERTQAIIDYMAIYEDFDNSFPGFETETHGIILKALPNGKKAYYVNCIK
jgi:lysine decarboxylase/arginine decarboxylase